MPDTLYYRTAPKGTAIGISYGVTSGGVSTTTTVTTGSHWVTPQDAKPITKEDLDEVKQEIIAEVCDFLETWLNEREDGR